MHVHQFSNMTRFDQRSAQCSFQKQPVWGQKPELYLLLMLLTQLSSIQSICWWYWCPLPSYPSVVIWGYSLWKLDQICGPSHMICELSRYCIWKVGRSKNPFSSFLKGKSSGLTMIWQQADHVGTARKGRSTSCTPCPAGGNLHGWMAMQEWAAQL